MASGSSQQLSNNGDLFVGYQGSWVLNDGGELGTQASTNDPEASVMISFFGTHIVVRGVTLPGSEHVSATYQIDNKSKHTFSVLNNSNPFPNNNETHFVSANLAQGRHRLVIDNINATSGRNYTLSSIVISGGVFPQSDGMESSVTLIVGVVLGVLALVFVIAFVGWRYRNIRIASRSKPLAENPATRLSARFIQDPFVAPLPSLSFDENDFKVPVQSYYFQKPENRASYRRSVLNNELVASPNTFATIGSVRDSVNSHTVVGANDLPPNRISKLNIPRNRIFLRM